MSIFFKLLRKAGLSKAAYSLLSKFAGKKSALSSDEARRILEKKSPDNGKTCIVGGRGVKEETAELDIIIPIYNVEEYLRECMDSVLSQKTERSFRVIAVNDGSTDSSGEILKDYAADPRVLVLNQENRGIGGARNTGIEVSSARYLYFLDSDDILLDGAVDAMLDCAESTGADVVEGAYATLKSDGRVINKTSHKAGPIEGDSFEFGFVCGKLFRRSVFENVNMPEGYWYEDSVISLIIFPRLKMQGRLCNGISECVFGYRQNPRGISRSGIYSPKCLDALWVQLSLFKDRLSLGIPVDRACYDYFLHMLVLTYHRTERQPKEIKEAIFAVWVDFFKNQLADFQTEDKRLKKLEQAVAAADYGSYSLFCALN